MFWNTRRKTDALEASLRQAMSRIDALTAENERLRADLDARRSTA